MSPEPLAAAKLREIRLLLMDVDGVLTDGGLFFGADGAAFKRFHVRDGLGIALLHQAGVECGIVSGRVDEYVRTRAAELGMSVVALGNADKGVTVERILREKRMPAARVAYVGDDVNDVPAFAKVGVAIAVADAHPAVFGHARFVTRAAGGQGAIREVADAILGQLESTQGVQS